MPDTEDDGWQELARELGLNEAGKTPPPAPPADEPADHAGRMEEDSDPELEVVEGSDTEIDADGGEGEADAPDAPGEGEPGTGRKRRRRRRRRKKGGPGQPAEAGAGEAPEAPAGETFEVTARFSPDAADAADEAGAGADDDEPGATPLAAEEDTGSEVLRELIAGWNVPSWDEIVAGLYRPER